MKVLGVFYGRCDASDWREAEQLAEYELLEDMDLSDVRHLSIKDQIFPFDFVATWHGQKCLVDVTLRAKKPVRTKRLSVWRDLGYTPTVLILLPKRMMCVLLELEENDTWANLTDRMIQKLEIQWTDFFYQQTLEREGK